MKPISIARFDQDIWIRITGRGNFKCSVAFKQLIIEMITKGYYHYIIDLRECGQLDSTFMGTMIGIAQRLRQYHQAWLRVVNVSPSNQETMENLGLDQFFLIQPLSLKEELPPDLNTSCFQESSISIPLAEEKVKLQEALVSAHQALVDLNKSNAEKFKNVFELCLQR